MRKVVSCNQSLLQKVIKDTGRVLRHLAFSISAKFRIFTPSHMKPHRVNGGVNVPPCVTSGMAYETTLRDFKV